MLTEHLQELVLLVELQLPLLPVGISSDVSDQSQHDISGQACFCSPFLQSSHLKVFPLSCRKPDGLKHRKCSWLSHWQFMYCSRKLSRSLSIWEKQPQAQGTGIIPGLAAEKGINTEKVRKIPTAMDKLNQNNSNNLKSHGTSNHP